MATSMPGDGREKPGTMSRSCITPCLDIVVIFLGGFSVEERVRVGRMCKWIIDYGRLMFMRSLGFTAKSLISYCEHGDSLEDCLLLGTKERSAE